MVIVWNNTQYPTPGSLSGTFYSNGGAAVLTFAGSAWSSVSNAAIGVNLLIDGNVVATLNGFTNEANSHKALVPAPFVVDLAAGQHTATIAAAYSNTNVDGNDFFTLVMTELAPSASTSG